MFAKLVKEQASFKDKKTGHFEVSRFLLGISHLLNRHAFTLALLAFDNAFGSDASLTVLGIANDQFHKFSMIGVGVIEQ